MTRTSLRMSIAGVAAILALAGGSAAAQHRGDASEREGGGRRYQGQFAQDWEAGRVPTDAEVAALERSMAGKAEDHAAIRRLGKGYFFQFFGARRVEAVPKARKLLGRALELEPNDAESLAYLGALEVLEANMGPEGAVRDAKLGAALAKLDRAQELGPNNGAVFAVTGATYLWFPDSYGTVPRAAASMERIRAAMGPMFSHFSHHGQQRILLTQGQAYARLGRTAEAKSLFREALAVDDESVEARILRSELDRLDRLGPE
jgi:tetratricopeptide (TPR) repeat protein